MAASVQPTFGVELEFILRYRIDDYEPARALGEGILWPINPYMPRTRQFGALVRAHIVTTLREAGFDVNDVVAKTNYQKWTVATDGSITWEDLRTPCGFEYCGIEVKSPAAYYSDEALMQIQKAVVLLKSNFEVFVNETCGLHVHVGNGRDGFPLQTLKNFCMLTTVFERQFDMIHPLHRLANHYTKRVSNQFHGMGPFERAQRVNALDDLTQLTECYHLQITGLREGYMAYNFMNLVPARPLNTVEFRQHEGSLNPEAVTKWVQLATSLIQIAHDAGPDGFAQLVNDHALDSDYTIIDLLHDLDLDELAYYYWEREIYNHSRSELDSIHQLEAHRRLGFEDGPN